VGRTPSIVTARPRSTNDSRRRPRRGSIHLRLARQEDRDFFFTTRRAAPGPYAEELWGWDDAHQRSLADKEFDELPVEIIEESGKLVGYLCVLHRMDHDFIDELALLPEAQGRGIGSSLVRDVMGAASARGVPVRLSVLVNNPARRLYEGLGFRVSSIEYPRVKMEWRAEPPP
jgi:ribosomal protein S18 acetylase RimI-like enzyme